MKTATKISLLFMTLTFFIHQGQTKKVNGLQRKESILQIDASDKSNIKIQYNIKNHLGEENNSPEIFSDQETSGDFKIRIHSFNHLYANHMEYILEEKKKEYKLFHDEEFAQLLVVRTEKWLTIFIYRYSEFSPRKFYYYEDQKIPIIDEQEEGQKRPGFNFEKFLVIPFDFTSEGKIEKSKDKITDDKICQISQSDSKNFLFPLRFQFFFIDGDHGYQSRHQIQVENIDQPLVPSFFMTKNDQDFVCKFDEDETFQLFKVSFVLRQKINDKTQPFAFFTSYLRVNQREEVQNLNAQYVLTEFKDITGQSIVSKETSFQISGCIFKEWDTIRKQYKFFQFNQTLIYKKNIQQSIYMIDKNTDVSRIKTLDIAFFGFKVDAEFMFNYKKFKELSCNIYTKTHKQEDTIIINVSFTIPENPVSVKQVKLQNQSQNNFKNSISQILVNFNPSNDKFNAIIPFMREQKLFYTDYEIQSEQEILSQYDQLKDKYFEYFYSNWNKEKTNSKISSQYQQFQKSVFSSFKTPFIFTLKENQIEFQMNDSINCKSNIQNKSFSKLKIVFLSQLTVENDENEFNFEITNCYDQDQIILSKCLEELEKSSPHQIRIYSALETSRYNCMATTTSDSLQIIVYEKDKYELYEQKIQFSQQDEFYNIDFNLSKTGLNINCSQLIESTNYDPQFINHRVMMFTNNEKIRELQQKFQKNYFKQIYEKQITSYLLLTKQFDPKIINTCQIDFSKLHFTKPQSEQELIDYKNQVTIDIHVFDSSTSFRLHILSFFKYELSAFDAQIDSQNSSFKSTSKPIKLTTVDITSRFQPKDLIYRVVDNFHGGDQNNKQVTSTVDRVRSVFLPALYYPNGYVSQGISRMIFYEFSFGGVYFVYLNPPEKPTLNLFYLFGQNYHLYGIVVGNINHQKIILQTPKENNLITQQDDYHLEIDLIDKRQDTLKNALEINDENYRFKYEKNGNDIQAVHYNEKYAFNLENDISYDLFITDDLSIKEPMNSKDKSPYEIKTANKLEYNYNERSFKIVMDIVDKKLLIVQLIYNDLF